MNRDLKKIKRKFGEGMMKFCRDTFPTILEHDGLLSELLLNHFAPSRELYSDIYYGGLITVFKNYIYSLAHIEAGELFETQKTPKELMNDVGYDLYECKSNADIQKFKKYYAEDEEICTFDDMNRLDRCRVFFAVKKDVDNIKREDFKHPEREDLYGTSVISIQFSKDEAQTLSIKNRYNHSVVNPDATFFNNLENITPGLTKSFEKEYGLIQRYLDCDLHIHSYEVGNDGKYYKYNQEYRFDNDVYYCPTSNTIIDHGEVKNFEKEKYIFLDYFILDLPNKKISPYLERVDDSFGDSMGEIEKIIVDFNDENKQINIIPKNGQVIKIVVDKSNHIIELENNNIEEIGDSFLHHSSDLKKLKLLNLKKVGNSFLDKNGNFESLKLPNLQKVGNYFLYNVKYLSKIDLPALEETGDGFLGGNYSVSDLCMPNLKKVGDNFLSQNTSLKILDLPSLEEIGNTFMWQNELLDKLNLPSLKKVGDNFLRSNNSLKEMYSPFLQEVGESFLENHKEAKKVKKL